MHHRIYYFNIHFVRAWSVIKPSCNGLKITTQLIFPFSGERINTLEAFSFQIVCSDILSKLSRVFAK